MKIAILTLPLHTNYGGILQAYALQTVLERMGHEVCIINYPLVRIPCFVKCVADYFNRRIRHLCGNKKIPIGWFDGMLGKSLINQYTNNFIDTYIKSRYVTYLSNLQKDEFDAIVVGSDQVWRKGYSIWPDIEDSYLSFAKDWKIKKISYAASFGKDDINDYSKEEIKNISNLLKTFDAITVREYSGIRICKEIFNVSAVQMIDPTLLLDKEAYNTLIAGHEIAFKGNFFNYVLDDNNEISDTILEIEKTKEWKSFKVNGKTDISNSKIEDCIQRPVEEWLQAFRDADAVITDSFHACVFSIIYNKPFIVFGNTKRGLSRFRTLLKLTHLEERLVTCKAEAIARIELLSVVPDAYNNLNDSKNKALEFLSTI